MIRTTGVEKATVLALLLVAATVTACGDALAPDPSHPFALTTDRSKYRPGETVIVRGRNLSGSAASFDRCIRYLVRDQPGPAPAATDTVAFMWYDQLVKMPAPQVLACDVAGTPRLSEGERFTTTVILPEGLAPSQSYRIVLDGLRGDDGREFPDEARSTDHFEVGP